MIVRRNHQHTPSEALDSKDRQQWFHLMNVSGADRCCKRWGEMSPQRLQGKSVPGVMRVPVMIAVAVMSVMAVAVMMPVSVSVTMSASRQRQRWRDNG